MFLQKINRLATDWNRHPQELDLVARESLLYGMRLTRHPSALKRELKKVKIDSLIARPLWSGNAYLLHVLPEVLCNKKKKIPCLEDFLFARKVIQREHLKELRARRKNMCKIPFEDLFKALMPGVKRQAWRGRFIPQFDAMNENLKDIEQDIVVRTLEVLNKEITNFKSKNKEEILAYLGFCVKGKSDTYLKQRTPKQIKARIEPEDFDRIVHQARQDEAGESEFADVDFKKDLQAVLSIKVYRGVALLMNFAEPTDTRKFDRYLRNKNIKMEWLTQSQLKIHIEKYIGAPVFERAFENSTLKEFLTNRTQRGDTNAFDSQYARCY
jgi:hypothetical protein